MPKGIVEATGRSHRFKNRAGQRSGRLVFTREIGKTSHSQIIWEAVCDCGNITSTATPSTTKSCGCIRSEMMAALGRSSKQENPVSRTKEYRKELVSRLKKDPVYSMHSRISRLHRHALSKVNAIKESPTFHEIGYTPEEFCRHIERQFHSGMSWANMSKWQIDHIIPIATAKTKDDVIALNQLSNLRPMLAKANNQKRANIETLL
jgi:hypothetical protein